MKMSIIMVLCFMGMVAGCSNAEADPKNNLPHFDRGLKVSASAVRAKHDPCLVLLDAAGTHYVARLESCDTEKEKQRTFWDKG